MHLEVGLRCGAHTAQLVALMKPVIAEFFGTSTLVLFGCGSAVLAGEQVGQLGIAFAFGLSIAAMA